MKHVFIVNPISGQGNGVEYIPVIDAYFKQNPGEYVIEITDRAGHATEIARKYSSEDDVILYSVGGDGTAKEVLDGINPGVTLCVVPGGTGNDFYKSIDQTKLSREERLKSLIEGENIQIDYGIMNGTSKFMNIASFGIDADINVYACDYVKKEMHIPGSLVYAYSAFKVGLKPKVIQMEMTIDGKMYERNIVLVSMANGRYYGGCFLPFPKAYMDDGYLDICAVKGPISTPRFIYLILKYMKGKHIGEKEIEIFHGRKISVRFNRDVNLQIDGENTKLREATFELFPKGLTIRVPKVRKLD